MQVQRKEDEDADADADDRAMHADAHVNSSTPSTLSNPDEDEDRLLPLGIALWPMFEAEAMQALIESETMHRTAVPVLARLEVRYVVEALRLRLQLAPSHVLQEAAELGRRLAKAGTAVGAETEAETEHEEERGVHFSRVHAALADAPRSSAVVEVGGEAMPISATEVGGEAMPISATVPVSDTRQGGGLYG